MECEGVSYNDALTCLIVSHVLNSFRMLLYPLIELMSSYKPDWRFLLGLADRTYRLICVVVNIWALLACQDYYLFIPNTCDTKGQRMIRQWLFVEISIFYLGIAAIAMFIFIANLRIRESGLEFKQKKEYRLDFLEKYDTMATVYQTYFILIGATIANCVKMGQNYQESGHFDPSDDYYGSAAMSLIVSLLFICFHLVQFVTVNIQMFMSDQSRREKTKLHGLMQLVGIYILPILMSLIALIVIIYFSSSGTSRHPEYLSWAVCEFFLNIWVSVAYSQQLSQIRQEHRNQHLNYEMQCRNDRYQQAIECHGYRPRLELSDDYYALSYCTYIQYYRERYSISEEQKSLYFSNVLVIFTMQLLLIFSVFYFINKEEYQDEGFMARMTMDVMVVRLLCALLMHLESEPEVRQGLAMFKYALNHQKVNGSIIKLSMRVFDEILFI